MYDVRIYTPNYRPSTSLIFAQSGQTGKRSGFLDGTQVLPHRATQGIPSTIAFKIASFPPRTQWENRSWSPSSVDTASGRVRISMFSIPILFRQNLHLTERLLTSVVKP